MAHHPALRGSEPHKRAYAIAPQNPTHFGLSHFCVGISPALCTNMPLILDSMIGMLNDLHPKEVFLDQNFKTSLAHSDPRQVSGSFRAGCYHPWCNQASMDSRVSDIHQNVDEFKVTLDVQQFRSDELTVKTVDYYIVIEGKHKENKDQFCIISNEFKRSYLLPNYVDIDHLTSSLSSDGLLTVHAPKKVNIVTKLC
uniref:SHSP domain-containing protein n=1 Tax=Timema shepardi TaxID=629360 RepID=A0A7R9AUG6_TIMSH|nr:unnamed protein product [Timema shepardi]